MRAPCAQDYQERKVLGDIEVVHKEKGFYNDDADIEELVAGTRLECDPGGVECHLVDVGSGGADGGAKGGSSSAGGGGKGSRGNHDGGGGDEEG
jgi:hypothetical protein